MANPHDVHSSSAYNEGMLQIQRLHFLWVQANNYSRSGRYDEWRWTLDAIWRELSRDALKQGKAKITSDDTKNADKNAWFIQFTVLDKKIDAAKELRTRYLALQDIEVFLRSLQDAVGKGGKYKDPGEDDMD